MDTYRIYKPLEYIVSPSGAYIDTGVNPNTSYKFITKFEIVSNSSWCLYANDAFFNASTIGMYHNSSSFNVSFGTSIKSNSALSKNTIYTIEHSHTENLTVNGNSSTYKTSVGNSINSATLKLFYSQYIGALFSGYQYFNGNRFYSQQIYNGSTLVRDFIPCILVHDTNQTSDGNTHNKGEIGLWDKVNQKFYGSKTSTAFTK